VLRKVAAQDAEAWLAQLRPADPLEALALEHSHPRWIAAAFRDALRGDLDATAAALAADDAAPEVHWWPGGCRARSCSPPAAASPGRGRRTPSAWRRATPATWRGARRPGRRAGRGQPAHGAGPGRRPRSKAGPAVGRPLRGSRGQGASLLDAVRGRARRALLAWRRSTTAPKLVRQSGPTLVATADSRQPPPAAARALRDRVLLDALQRARRAPPASEARWRRRPTDLPGLTRLQGELLDAAASLLRPGGVAVYATCSPHLAETVVPVLDVLRRHPSSSRSTSARSCPGCRTSGRGRRCSCGRTCTAPTRCT
jgi:16S rRNA (cytosine967-C5)-methyltransferase